MNNERWEQALREANGGVMGGGAGSGAGNRAESGTDSRFEGGAGNEVGGQASRELRSRMGESANGMLTATKEGEGKIADLWGMENTETEDVADEVEEIGRLLEGNADGEKNGAEIASKGGLAGGNGGAESEGVGKIGEGSTLSGGVLAGEMTEDQGKAAKNKREQMQKIVEEAEKIDRDTKGNPYQRLGKVALLREVTLRMQEGYIPGAGN